MPARIWIRKCRRSSIPVPWEYIAVATDHGELLGFATGVAPTQPTALARAEADLMDVYAADDDRLELAAFRAMTLAEY